jgi:hypothetical protein
MARQTTTATTTTTTTRVEVVVAEKVKWAVVRVGERESEKRRRGAETGSLVTAAACCKAGGCM